MRIFVGGVNGTGKTTIITEFVKRHPQYEHISAARAFSKWLGFGDGYDQLRAMPQDMKSEKLIQFMNKTLDESSKDIVFDSHYLNLIRGVVLKTTDSWLGKCDALVLISSDFESVWKRIKNDTRDRALFPDGLKDEDARKMYKNYKEMYKKEFLALVEKHHLPYLELQNGEGKIDETMVLLSKFVTNLESSNI